MSGPEYQPGAGAEQPAQQPARQQPEASGRAERGDLDAQKSYADSSYRPEAPERSEAPPPSCADPSSRAERGDLDAQKSYADDSYRPGISDREPQSAAPEQAAEPPDQTAAELPDLAPEPGDSATPDRDSAAADRPPRDERPGPIEEVRRTAQEAGKNLGDMPDLPRATLALDKGVSLGVGAAHIAGAMLEIGALELTGVAGAAVEMGHQWLEATKEWSDASAKALHMASAQLSMKLILGDAITARSSHVTEGSPYTLDELRGRITERFGYGAYDRQAMEVAGAGRDAGKHIDRGIADAADVANRLVRQYHTPAERQTALKSLAESVLQRIELGQERRAHELRGRPLPK